MKARAIIAATLCAVLASALPASSTTAASTAADGFDFSRPEVVGSGLAIPWGLAFLPDGSALAAERNTARIVRLRPGTAPQTVGTVPGVSPTGEGGLLGLAVSPNYAQDGFVYAYFTASGDNRIVRFQITGTITPQVVRSGIPRASIHDGGRIAFGPDGMLYAGTGDANNTANAQNLNSLGGKILRMTPTGGVPADNPFANSVVYTRGHRNVQGLAWDAQGRMYAGEFGQNRFDEINRIVAGGNYGWPNVEGTGGGTTYRDPIVVWTTAEASPSGIAISGSTLYAAALRGTRLWRVPLNPDGGAGTPNSVLNGTFGRLRTVVAGPDGHLWIGTSNRDGRGNPVPSDDRVVRFPPLGDPPAGLFTDDFETDKGWTVNPGGSDTATAGAFQRGVAQPTNNAGTPLQLAAAGGSNDLVTGAPAGASVGANDLDGGTTSVQSPAIQLPAGNLTLTFNWYLGHLNNASAADYLRVRVVGTSTTTVLNQTASATNRAAAWQTATVNLSPHAGQSVRIVVDAADTNPGSLVEAAVDNINISQP